MTGARHSWEYPDCPECGESFRVRASYSNTEDWTCDYCEIDFS